MWRTEVRVKTKRKTLRGMREKEAILYSSPKLLSGSYFTFSSPTGFLWGFFGAGRGAMFALLFRVFQESINSLILFYHHLSANTRSLFHYMGVYRDKGELYSSLFLSVSVCQMEQAYLTIKFSKVIHLYFFPIQGIQACICLALT